MRKHLIPCGFILAVLGLVGGCSGSGTAARIREKHVTFVALAPAQQEQIRNGGIEPGYNQDMVYMALGQPARITTSANGKDTTWVYKNYFPPAATPQASLRWTAKGGLFSGTGRYATSRENSNVSTGNGSYGPYGSSSLSGTDGGGQEASMELPDLPSATFYVTFRRNKVIDMRLDE